MTSDPSSKRRGSAAGPSLARELGGIVMSQLRDALVQRTSLTKQGRGAVTTTDEPPVVAQLMVEIRSDGSRTIARGALNDLRSGESAQVLAEGRTPAELMMSLASSLLALPATLFSQPGARAGSSTQELPPKVSSQPQVAAKPGTQPDDERSR
jgi:hypothetical protein